MEKMGLEVVDLNLFAKKRKGGYGSFLKKQITLKYVKNFKSLDFKEVLAASTSQKH